MRPLPFFGSSVVLRRRILDCTIAVATAFAAGTACAQQLATDQVPPPLDLPYVGTIALRVDCTDTEHGIFRIHESIPVKPGPLTLLYPQWIPGNHSPTGPIAMLAGLKLSGGGKPITWTRDKYNVYAFHIEVPANVFSIDADFQHVSERADVADFEITDRLMYLEWSKVALYPGGYYARQITFAPSVALPHGWQFGTALDGASDSGDTTTFAPVTLEKLVDSPIYAGEHFRRVPLTQGKKAPVYLDLVADDAKDLEMTTEQLAVHRNLIVQAGELFGSHHYDHYDFLLSLSNQLTRNGLEHHQSSENGTGNDYFTDWDRNVARRDQLAHEYAHSWNGKFRRPADLWIPNFNVPMGDSLLWVYEGQTQYWGFVLTARAGMWTPQQFRDGLAAVAATYDRNRPGFQWRTLEDTTTDTIATPGSPSPYRSWQTGTDYYSGGQLVWLAVDAKLRSLTHDKQSLDDFARVFFGGEDGAYEPKTYTFDDLVVALNGLVKYDWSRFLKERVYTLNPPLQDGLAATGWKLVYDEKESEFEQQYDGRAEGAGHLSNFSFSIGLTLMADGTVNDARWDGPAFRAGVSAGAVIVAVNGMAYSDEVLRDSITAVRGGGLPIELTMKYQGRFRKVLVDYHGGLQYPHLVRVTGTPDYLSEIIASKK